MSKSTLSMSAAILTMMLALPVAAEDKATDHADDHGAAAAADHGTETHAETATDHGSDTPMDAPDSATGSPDLDRVVATVGDTEITVGHMIVAKASLPQQYQQIPDEQLWDGLLEQLVQQEVLAQSTEATETPLVRLSLANERRSLLAAVAITRVAEREVTEEKILELYQRDYVNAEKGKEYNASHILLETKEAAEEVLAEVKGGADFAEKARERSTGPSGPNGGALGWFGAGMMVEPFQQAVETLGVGDITGPIETQFGWHVIKLNDTRATTAPLLDEVRGEITQKAQQDVVEAHIRALTDRADVTRTPVSAIDPSVLSNTEALER